MRKPVNVLTLMLAVVSALALTACGGGSGGGGEGGGTGTLSVGITDAGADMVTEVHVTFTGITVKPKSGGQQHFPIDPPIEVDLMKLTGENSVNLIGDQQVPAGEYNWIALEVAANTGSDTDSLWVIQDGGLREPMEIPSGQQSGLRLVSGFTVLANRTTALMIDWDLRKALSMPSNGKEIWKLRPALRITDLAVYGRIEGTVSDQLFMGSPAIDDACDYDVNEDEGNAVYAFKVPEPDSDSGEPPLAERFAAVMVDDIDDNELDGENPYATAVVKWDGVSSYSYAFDYMSIGDYKLAFTCEASLDVVDVDNTDNLPAPDGEPKVDFAVLPDPVTVTDGQTTTAPEFDPAP